MPGSICECYNGVVYYRNSIFCPINVTHCAPEKRGPSPPPHPSCLQCGCWEENCIHENCRCDNGIMYLIDSPGVCAMNEEECQKDGFETDQPKFHCLPCKVLLPVKEESNAFAKAYGELLNGSFWRED
ncbi:hypothetical protein V5799_031933 [Amblyomma americanum]|uniref:Uncharacterized protein n=1 Tax=Amblyomma americanum TaxID=6943 RepID=A0AAQ4DSL9_AMBAM